MKKFSILFIIALMVSSIGGAVNAETTSPAPYYDDFNYASADLATNWNKSYLNKVKAEIEQDENENGAVCLSATSEATAIDGNLRKYISNVPRKFVVSFRISSNMKGGTSAYTAVALENSNAVSQALFFMTQGGSFMSNTTGGITYFAFENDAWYHVTAYFDPNKTTFLLVFGCPDGTEKAYNVPFTNPAFANTASGFTNQLMVRFSYRNFVTAGTVKYAKYDDFKLYAMDSYLSELSHSFELRNGDDTTDITNSGLTTGKIALKINLENYSIETNTFTIIYALMDGDEILDAVCVPQVIPPREKNFTAEAVLDVTEVKPTYKLVAFVWDKVSGLNALTKEKILAVK